MFYQDKHFIMTEQLGDLYLQVHGVATFDRAGYYMTADVNYILLDDTDVTTLLWKWDQEKYSDLEERVQRYAEKLYSEPSLVEKDEEIPLENEA